MFGNLFRFKDRIPAPTEQKLTKQNIQRYCHDVIDIMKNSMFSDEHKHEIDSIGEIARLNSAAYTSGDRSKTLEDIKNAIDLKIKEYLKSDKIDSNKLQEKGKRHWNGGGDDHYAIFLNDLNKWFAAKYKPEHKADSAPAPETKRPGR